MLHRWRLPRPDRGLPERAVPTRLGAALFQFKVNLFRARRFAAEFGRAPARLAKGDPAAFGAILAESRSPLWSDPRAGERALQWGKVQNLRVAARLLDRTVLPEGAVFSFWRQMGRASGRRGFVAGRMLQEGCLVPATGGGLCQLSNALYDAALTAGCAIVERHAHSRIVPGSRGIAGRDATVAWNYVDLRFAAPRAAMLRVTVERDELVVRLVAQGAAVPPENRFAIFDLPAMRGGGTESCGTCAETGCFRHEGGRAAPEGAHRVPGRRELARVSPPCLGGAAGGRCAGAPLDGARWKAARYAWDTGGFGRVAPASLTAIARSLRLRFAKDGPKRRAAEMRGAQALARRFARALTPDVTEVVAAQSLLPFLWREGHLGGRRLSVLMTRMPMAEIEARLDAGGGAAPRAAHPGGFPRRSHAGRGRARGAGGGGRGRHAACGDRQSVRRTRRAARLGNAEGPCADGRRHAAPYRLPGSDQSRARALTKCARRRRRSTWKSCSSAARWKARISGAACAPAGRLRKTGSMASRRWCSLPCSKTRRAGFSWRWHAACR
ncbi:MAG: VanW family protein [Rhizomicrobium sp.]